MGKKRAADDGSESNELQTRIPPEYLDGTDAYICCSDGKKLKAHACILSMCSPVLRGLFEAVSNQQQQTVNIKVEDPSELWLEALPWLYPSMNSAKPTWDQVYKLIQVAHKYDIKHVLNGCQAFLLEQGEGLSHDRTQAHYVLKWAELSERLGLTEQLQRCISYFKDHRRTHPQPTSWRCSSASCLYRNTQNTYTRTSCSYCGAVRPEHAISPSPADDKEWLKKLSADTLVELLGN